MLTGAGIAHVLAPAPPSPRVVTRAGRRASSFVVSHGRPNLQLPESGSQASSGMIKIVDQLSARRSQRWLNHHPGNCGGPPSGTEYTNGLEHIANSVLGVRLSHAPCASPTSTAARTGSGRSPTATQTASPPIRPFRPRHQRNRRNQIDHPEAGMHPPLTGGMVHKQAPEDHRRELSRK